MDDRPDQDPMVPSSRAIMVLATTWFRGPRVITVYPAVPFSGETAGSPLATKFIGGVLKDNLNERDWRTVLESNLFGQNSIDFVLGISYKVLPNHPQNCFTSVDPHNSNHA
ncbi:hypothetical protein IEQ34_010982 [Dendrobium chrysotoxum]|uniref:Uncharacterized protein n=1 Tax=Dendrobium chrysotoxum TaxID=161865 RepID=A0AAV7GEZ0_DENCH|nr:hypothetical protein IEQ34_010982 [Dendrobium chrysotoxum]